jgi:hypothetical protein
MSLLDRRKLILAKIETAYGTDSGPSGAANAILTTGLKIMPMEGDDVDRELDTPWFGAQPTIPAGLHAKVSFSVELEPSGIAGTAPGWGVLMRACAMAQTISAGVSVTYSPITANPHDAVTIHVNLDGVNYILLGARGTVKLTMAAQAIPKLEFEFQGLWTAPADVAAPTPVYTAFPRPLVSNVTNTPVFTVNATTLRLKELTFDLANAIENRFLIGGTDEVIITDRKPMIEMEVEARPMATLNPYTLARDQTAVALVLQHGVAAGRRATLNVPRLQLMRPDSPGADQGRIMFPLKGSVLPNTGNDEFTLVLT